MLENLLVPEFEAPATGGKTFRLSAARGHPLVLYFYPKDNTPGCTDEGAQFRDLYGEFQKLGCERLWHLARQHQVARRLQGQDELPVRPAVRPRGSAVPDVRRHEDEEHVRQAGARASSAAPS